MSTFPGALAMSLVSIAILCGCISSRGLRSPAYTFPSQPPLETLPEALAIERAAQALELDGLVREEWQLKSVQKQRKGAMRGADEVYLLLFEPAPGYESKAAMRGVGQVSFSGGPRGDWPYLVWLQDGAVWCQLRKW